jgi:hypothetical protein
LRFNRAEGRNLNAFYRRGPVAAHLLLRSGNDPRILVAFPAGDSGVGLWFAREDASVSWRLLGELRPIERRDAKDRPLRGIEAEFETDAAELRPRQFLLSSIRILRIYETFGSSPPVVLSEPVIKGRTIACARDRLDGAPGYQLKLTVVQGSLASDGAITAGGGVIRLRMEALTGEQPLTPLTPSKLLNGTARPDPELRETLTFLSYREKLLAGSWRYDTYFGRDTLISVLMLMPVLTPGAIESALGSVIARLSQDGEVAHEEAIGEFAVLTHMAQGQGASDAPVYDYAMIDSSYGLAPVAARWLLDDRRGRRAATAFLSRPSGPDGAPGECVGQALMRNYRFVLSQTQAFAKQPAATALLAIKPGQQTGQWRDTPTGLGEGVYPFDVNAVMAPAALQAIARLHDAGLLEPYLTASDRPALAGAAHMAKVWRDNAPRLFEVEVQADQAKSAVASFAKAQGVPADPALTAIDGRAVRFHALSLDAQGNPIAVVNSDEAFYLLFGRPSPEELTDALDAMMAPFPAGLMTPIGLLVANPVYSTGDKQALFTRNAYHGMVVWSWQQAVLAAGLEHQLRRGDLPPALRRGLREAQTELWTAIEADKSVESSELWSWTWGDGAYRSVPFGEALKDADESNAAQLWSTVFLALEPPGRSTR